VGSGLGSTQAANNKEGTMLVKRFGAKMLGLAVLSLVGAASARAGDAGISWFKDLERASEVAQKTNQPMMIEFWADWCSSCKVMDEDIFTNTELIAAVGQRIVPVRIHFDLQKDLVRKYNVPAIPYIVFTNSHGTKLMHHQGILNARDLIAVIKALPPDVSQLNRFDQLLQEDKNHFESLFGMARELRAAGFFESSNKYFTRALKHQDAKRDSGKREVILMKLGLNFLELQDDRQAMQTFEKCLKEFPASRNRPDFLLNLARSYILSDRKEKALESLEALMNGFPESEASRNAQVLLKSL
jgi:thioredoxin-like negative regulator of GroEL